MKKLIEIGPTFANTHEPSISLLDLGDKQSLEKTAATIDSEAYAYAATMEPKEGHTYILVIAMGAGEYYGPNKNSDYFPEEDLYTHKQYLNFETKYVKNPKTGKDEINEGALFYKHHKNKVAKGHPWFGTVHKAFYNTRMHRVELIIDIHHSQPGAMELVDKVHSGGTFSVSMGVNISHDQCSICGHKASKLKDYCDHLKYELGNTRPDGKRVYAINGGYDYKKNPKALNFFDISYVFRPADKTGYMLKKVATDLSGNDFECVTGSAEAYEKLAALQEKSAALRKMSEITKYFEGQAVNLKDSDNHQLKVINRNPAIFENVVSQMQELTPEHYEKLSKYPMGEILSSLSDLGIILTTPEFIRMVVYKKTGEHIPMDMLRQVCKDQSKIFEELAENPEIVSDLEEKMTMLHDHRPNDEIKNIVDDIKESRDLSTEGFAKKAAVSFMRSELDFYDPANVFSGRNPKGMHHTESIVDPQTGKTYVASMGAIDDARDIQRVKELSKIVGGAGLLGGTYAYLRSIKSGLAPAVGIGTLALGAKMLYDKFKKDQSKDFYVTESGMKIPRQTAMFEKKSSVGSRARTTATLGPGIGAFIGSKYYENRLRNGTAGTYRTELEKYMDNAGRIAYEHPILTTGAGMTAGHIGLNALEAARKLLGK